MLESNALGEVSTIVLLVYLVLTFLIDVKEGLSFLGGRITPILLFILAGRDRLGVRVFNLLVLSRIFIVVDCHQEILL